MSRLVLNRNNGSADEFGHLLGLSRLLGSGDVIEGLGVVATTSPSMAVVVQQGSAGINTGTYPDSYRYWCAIDTTAGTPAGESVTITTANPSNPRIDVIVGYIDLAVTASSGTANNPNNMFKLVAVAGTPAGSPSAPNNAAIQSAIGASNPFMILANVLVGTSVTSINNGNITDRRSYVQVNNNSLGVAAQSWTPTWTGVTIGNAVVTGKYTLDGKKLKGRLSVIVGSSTVVTGNIQFSLPQTAISYPGTANVALIGWGTIYDVSGGIVYKTEITYVSTTTAGVGVEPANGTWVTTTNANASFPVATASPDEWFFTFEVEVP